MDPDHGPGSWTRIMDKSDRLAARNARVLDGLVARRPEPFPNAVWRHALGLRLVPETPGRAVEAYWRAHPLRADHLARALARRSGAPHGWGLGALMLTEGR